MALGIVVDDAIVVGEEAVTQFDAGASPADAATTGARRMLAPVIASSLTTLCAFTPLVVSDEAPLVEIAMVMLVVISASLIECFLILPGHLRHAFDHMGRRPMRPWRQRFNAAFESFRDQRFLPLVRRSLENRGAVLTAAAGMFVVVALVPVTGWIKTEMNLNLDFEEIRADVRFVPGSSSRDKDAFIAELEGKLLATDADLGGGAPRQSRHHAQHRVHQQREQDRPAVFVGARGTDVARNNATSPPTSSRRTGWRASTGRKSSIA